MKVLVDPEIFFYGRCGMARYYSKLLAILQTKHNIEIDLPLLVSGSDFIQGKYQSLSGIKNHLPFGRKLFNKLSSASKRMYWKKVASSNYDLVFITSPVFEDRFLDFLPAGKKFIMVVHDTMQCVLTPEGLYDTPGLNADKLSYLARRASKVICISETTKRDLLSISSGKLKNVEVIYTGNLLEPLTGLNVNIQLPDQFLLFVGDRSGRKNFRMFIQAIAPILKDKPFLKVVCTQPFTKFELDFWNELEVTNSIVFIDAPDSTLKQLYAQATALVYPSLYEGYGLPVLEAMSMGCPVITSSNSAIQEIAQTAAVYIDPLNSNSIMAAVCKVISPDFDKEAFTIKGFYHSKGFSVDSMSDQFYQAMRTLMTDSLN